MVKNVYKEKRPATAEREKYDLDISFCLPFARSVHTPSTRGRARARVYNGMARDDMIVFDKARRRIVFLFFLQPLCA